MAGARRCDRINRRDLEVLDFIARFGTVPRAALASWSGAGRSVQLARERRAAARRPARRAARPR
jgi:hypothetical protein